MKKGIAAVALSLVLAPLAGATGAPDPAAFDAVLEKRARNGGFDYAGADGQDRKRLSAYAANLGDAQPAAMAPDEKKAFYINAYNVFAIETLLERTRSFALDPGRPPDYVSSIFVRRHEHLDLVWDLPFGPPPS